MLCSLADEGGSGGDGSARWQHQRGQMCRVYGRRALNTPGLGSVRVRVRGSPLSQRFKALFQTRGAKAVKHYLCDCAYCLSVLLSVVF